MEGGIVERTRAMAGIGACVLTAAGGAMDAWVYLAHGHMFANAQTGNIVLLALHLTAGDSSEAARVVPSVVAFVAGLLSSRLAGAWLKKHGLNSRDWRLAAEVAVLVVLASVAGDLPQDVVTAWVGFIAAVQITSLTHIGTASFNTGMTTGNLRGAVSAAVAAWLDPTDTSQRGRATLLGWMCLAFLVGALFGGVLTRWLGDRAVFAIAALVACATLVIWRTPDPIPSP